MTKNLVYCKVKLLLIQLHIKCSSSFYVHLYIASTLGARDFSSGVSGFCQVFLSPARKASPLVNLAYGRRCVDLQPTPKIPAAREKNLWYLGYIASNLVCRFYMTIDKLNL